MIPLSTLEARIAEIAHQFGLDLSNCETTIARLMKCLRNTPVLTCVALVDDLVKSATVPEEELRGPSLEEVKPAKVKAWWSAPGHDGSTILCVANGIGIGAVWEDASGLWCYQVSTSKELRRYKFKMDAMDALLTACYAEVDE